MAITVDPRIPVHPVDLEHYERMIDRGVFDEDDRIELLNGVLSEKMPQGEDHAGLIVWLTEEFAIHARTGGYRVRPQLPMRLPPDSMPEPDLALAARPLGRPTHPEHAWLAIEVSVTSQATDSGVKAELYAAAGIDELWVIDVPTRTVHVHRHPTPTGYAEISPVTTDELRCALPGAPPIDIGELFRVLDEA